MSRKLILTLAAAATISLASFASSSSYAHGGGGHGGGHAGGGHAGGHHAGGNHDGIHVGVHGGGVRGGLRVGGRYYGGVWYGNGRRLWAGRCWAYELAPAGNRPRSASFGPAAKQPAGGLDRKPNSALSAFGSRLGRLAVSEDLSAAID